MTRQTRVLIACHVVLDLVLGIQHRAGCIEAEISRTRQQQFLHGLPAFHVDDVVARPRHDVEAMPVEVGQNCEAQVEIVADEVVGEIGIDLCGKKTPVQGAGGPGDVPAVEIFVGVVVAVREVRVPDRWGNLHRHAAPVPLEAPRQDEFVLEYPGVVKL